VACQPFWPHLFPPHHSRPPARSAPCKWGWLLTRNKIIHETAAMAGPRQGLIAISLPGSDVCGSGAGAAREAVSFSHLNPQGVPCLCPCHSTEHPKCPACWPIWLSSSFCSPSLPSTAGPGLGLFGFLPKADPSDWLNLLQLWRSSCPAHRRTFPRPCSKQWQSWGAEVGLWVPGYDLPGKESKLAELGGLQEVDWGKALLSRCHVPD
jgi:hypothetical protein